MTLAERVRVSRRFHRSVRIDADLDDPAALEGYICPPSAAQALSVMARHLVETGQGAFTWTGPYGGGKSSLAVVLGALVGPPGERRGRAAAAVGRACAEEVWRAMPLGDEGWTVLPVIGRRADPAVAIGEVLDALGPVRRPGCSRRETAGDDTGGSAPDVVERLERAAGGGGLLLVIDEMGKFLEEAAWGSADLYVFQQLAEAASRSRRRLVVLGVLHQAFEEYAGRLAREVRDEWAKVQGRFVDIPLSVAGEEQIELLARAIEADGAPVGNRRLAETAARAIRRSRPAASASLGKALHGCWPLHPVTACLLGPISRRRFGQNQRSVFGFLNSAEPFGFQEFLREHGDAEAATYEPARLWDYLRANLEPSILASPDGHRWATAVEAVSRCEALGGDLEHLRVAKAIALLDLFREPSGLAAARDVLAAAAPDIAAAHLTAILDDLKAWSIVIYKRHLGAFALYAGSDFDIERAVEQAQQAAPALDFGVLRRLAPLQPIVAKRHYHETGAFRWFEVDLAPLADATSVADGWKPENGATGLFLLLLATEGEPEARARRVCREAADTAVDHPVVVGLARNSWYIRNLARELVALERVRTERPELGGDAVARREIEARLAATSAELEEELRQAFVSARWHWGERHLPADHPQPGDLAELNAVASGLADRRYHRAPRIRNELLNRVRPSSNAVAAQKALLRAMVGRAGEPRLGIEGFPAEGGLFASLLEQTGLYRPDPGRPGIHRFADPPEDGEARLAPLWAEADELFQGRAGEAVPLAELYDLWRAPPYGVRDGLLPVLAVAYALTRAGHLAVYLDGVFRPTLDDLLVDRLMQEAASVRLRRVDFSGLALKILTGIADVVARYGPPIGSAVPEPIDVARRLVAIVQGLKPWTLRTAQLSENARRLRALVKGASDPNRFLFDDLPRLFVGEEASLDEGDVDGIVASLRAGLDELVMAYPTMLRELGNRMLFELQVPNRSGRALAALNQRARNVRHLTGDFRLDAFATRLTTFTGAEEEVEGIASLAANKPPRDWTDRDLDRAAVEIADLAQRFNHAEAFARVKNRRSTRHAVAIAIGLRDQPVTLTREFTVAEAQREKVEDATAAVLEALEPFRSQQEVVLAALAQVGAGLLDGARSRRTRKEDEELELPLFEEGALRP